MKEKQLVWDGFLITLFFLLVMFVTTCPAKAAPVCEGEDCAVHLARGDPAPYAGMLLSTKLAIDQATKAHDTDEMIAAAVERAEAIARDDLDLAREKRANDLRTHALEKDLLSNRLLEAHNASTRSWYEHPALWYTLGFITGVAATSAAVYVGVRVLDASK